MESSETFQANSSLLSQKQETTKLYESILGLNEFNNSETSDKILIININNQKHSEIYIHSDIIKKHSNFLNKQEIDSKLVRIELDSPYAIIDLLIYIYTKDIKKLKKYLRSYSSFMSLLILSNKFKMNKSFFDIIVNGINFIWQDTQIQNDEMWSYKSFDFDVLKCIVESVSMKISINSNPLIKIHSLLAWLNSVDNHRKELLETYLVKDYIIKYDLMKDLSYNNLKSLITLYYNSTLAFDFKAIFDQFIFCKLKCLACCMIFDSIYSTTDSICKSSHYHPISKSKCLYHESCTYKSLSKDNTLSCCHKPINSKGCIITENKHILTILKN